MIKDSAKTILCYGDSNTWGAVPNTDDRYPRGVRWPSVLQNMLGDGNEVISEGLCGRNFASDEPKKPHRNGIIHVQAILESADPVDLMIIMLGTNDMKSVFNLSAEQISENLDKMISFIKSGNMELQRIPQMLIVCPPAVRSIPGLDERMVRAVEISPKLPALFKSVAEKHDCAFLDAGTHISSSEIDGYHLSAEAHLTLAAEIRRVIGL